MEYGESTSEMLLLLTFVALGTTLIWSGLGVLDPAALAFAGIALAARTVVMYPMLGGIGLERSQRGWISLLGARGLSSLLLALLPVFAGVNGAERLFAITCLVVLLSLAIHGVVMAWVIGAARRVTAGTPPSAAVDQAIPDTPLRITLEELSAIEAGGEPVVIVDARTWASRMDDPRYAEGAVRIDPDEARRMVAALALPKNATLAIYCT